MEQKAKQDFLSLLFNNKSVFPKPKKTVSFETFLEKESPEQFSFPLQDSLLDPFDILQSQPAGDIDAMLQRSQEAVGKLVRLTGNPRLMIQGRRGIIYQQSGKKPTVIEARSQIETCCLYEDQLFMVTEGCECSLYDTKAEKYISERMVMGVSEPPTAIYGLSNNPHAFIAMSGKQVNIFVRDKALFGPDKLIRKEVLNALPSDPFVMISLLENQKYLARDVAYQGCDIFAVSTTSTTYLLRVQNFRMSFANPFRRLETVNAGGYLSWGEALLESEQSQEQRPVLAITLQNTIVFLAPQQKKIYEDKDQKSQIEWTRSHKLLVSELGPSRQLIGTFFPCSNQILLLLSTGQTLSAFFPRSVFEKATQLRSGVVSRLEIPFLRSTVTLEQKLSQKELERRIQEGNVDLSHPFLKTFHVFSNSFYCKTGQRSLFYVVGRKVAEAKYFDWDTILHKLQTQQRFQDCMILIVALTNGKPKFSGGEIFKPTSQFATQIVVQFLRVKLQVIRQSGMTGLFKMVVVKAIQFLQALGLEEVLFGKVRKEVTDLVGIAQFWCALTPFIVHNRVSKVPSQALKDLLQFFIKQEDYDVIQRLILSIDLRNVERSLLIQCCLQNKMVVSLAYICTQGNQGQFITPFAKLWGECYQQHNNNCPGEASFYAIRVLWYVKVVLQRSMTLKLLKDQVFQQRIVSLTMAFFNDKIIPILLVVEPWWTFEALICYFSMEITMIINSNPKIKLPETKPLDWVVAQGMPIETMLAGIQGFVRKVARTDVLLTNYMLFLSRVALFRSVKLKKDKQSQILQYLIENNDRLQSINFGQNQEEYHKLHQQYGHLNDFQEILACRYLVKLLITWIHNFKPRRLLAGKNPDQKQQRRQQEKLDSEYTAELRKYKNQLQSFLSLSATRKLTELTAQIAFQLGDFQRCIAIFLKSSSEFMRSRVFPFLTDSLRELQLRKSGQFKILKDKLLANMSHLVELNSETARVLIFEYLPEDKQRLISQIKDRRVKLQYIEKLLAAKVSLSAESMITHIDLLSEFRPMEVGPVIRAHVQYPVQECLDICKDKQILDAMQYLYQRLGEVNLSVSTAVKRLRSEFEAWVSMEQQQFGEIRAKIGQILSDVLQLCKRNNLEELWRELLEQCIALFDKYQNLDPEAQEMAYDIEGRVIESIHVEGERMFLALLDGEMRKLRVGKGIREAFVRIFSNFSYAQNILFSAESLIKYNLFIEKYMYYYTNCRAHASPLMCEACQYSLEYGKSARVFNCGHSFHSNCLTDLAKLCPCCLKAEDRQYQFYLEGRQKFKLTEYFAKIDEQIVSSKSKFKEMFEEQQTTKEQKQAAKKARTKLEELAGFDRRAAMGLNSSYEYEATLSSMRLKS